MGLTNEKTVVCMTGTRVAFRKLQALIRIASDIKQCVLHVFVTGKHPNPCLCKRHSGLVDFLKNKSWVSTLLTYPLYVVVCWFNPTNIQNHLIICCWLCLHCIL